MNQSQTYKYTIIRHTYKPHMFKKGIDSNQYNKTYKIVKSKQRKNKVSNAMKKVSRLRVKVRGR